MSFNEERKTEILIKVRIDHVCLTKKDFINHLLTLSIFARITYFWLPFLSSVYITQCWPTLVIFFTCLYSCSHYPILAHVTHVCSRNPIFIQISQFLHVLFLFAYLEFLLLNFRLLFIFGTYPTQYCVNKM